MTAITLLGVEPTQWLVVIKPKIRYIAHMPTYMVTVEAEDVHAALYEAKTAHPSVFNTLNSKYHDPVAKPVILNVLRTLTPHVTPKG